MRGGEIVSAFVAGIETGIGVKGVASVGFGSGAVLNAGSGLMDIQLSSRDGRGAPVRDRQIVSFLKTNDILTSNEQAFVWQYTILGPSG